MDHSQGGAAQRSGAAMRSDRWRRPGAIASVVALFGLGMSTQSAHAGTYVMRNCDVPGYANAPLGPWQLAQLPANMSMADQCEQGRGVSFVFAGDHRLTANGGPLLTLARPESGPQGAIRFVKIAVTYAARLAGTGPGIHLVTQEYHSNGGFFAGAPLGPPGAEDLVLEQTFNPQLTSRYMVGVSCSPGITYGPECFPTHDVPLLLRGMAVTLSEDILPTAAAPGGTLLVGGAQSGTRTVTYSATDSQSGVAKVDVLLGDAVVASRDLTTQCSYNDFTVCPVTSDGSLEVDTRTAANGSQPLSLRVKDAAGNQQTVRAPNPVQVANAGTTQERLSGRFVGSSRRTLTVPFVRRVRIRGRLTNPIGRGIGRARIDVFERISQRGQRQRAVGSVRTRADGSFAYLLAKGRASRAVRLAYSPKGARNTVSMTLHLRVRASSSLRASLRGTLVRFGGRVVSGPLPQNGKRVLLQGRAPGFSWATFASVRTNRRGRFSGRYRLPVRRPGIRLHIRVVVPTERSYPYAAFSGRPVTLRVR